MAVALQTCVEGELPGTGSTVLVSVEVSPMMKGVEGQQINCKTSIGVVLSMRLVYPPTVYMYMVDTLYFFVHFFSEVFAEVPRFLTCRFH